MLQTTECIANRSLTKWLILLLLSTTAACETAPPPQAVAKGSAVNPEPLIEPVRLDPDRPQNVLGRKGLTPKVCSDVEVTHGRMTADTIIVPTADQAIPPFELSTDDIALAPDGSLYVADHRDNQLVHVSADGRILERFGGEGKGPGEFTGAISVTLGPDGSIYGGDTRGRINVFSPDGKVIRAIQVPGIMEVADMVVLPNGNIAVTTLVEVAAVDRPYVRIVSPTGDVVHDVLHVSGGRAKGERPFMHGINFVRLSAGPDGRFAIWYPIDNYIEVADSAGVLLARIEGCFPRELRDIYARYFSPRAEAISYAPQTKGVWFDGPDRIRAATFFATEEGSGIRLRTYSLRGEELDARDFPAPPVRRIISRLLFRDDSTLVAFSDGADEQGVYRFNVRAPGSR